MADAFLLKNDSGPSIPPHSEGQFPSVCVDFLDLGNRVKQFPGSPPKLTYCIAVSFQSGEKDAQGRMLTVNAEFTASMHEKASLRKFLEDWRGKTYTKEEVAQGIPADKLVGRPCLLTVEHKVSGGGRTYAKIRGIAPLPKQIPAPVLPAYERPAFWDERKKAYATEAAQFERDHAPHSDPPFSPEDLDDIGF